MRDVSGQAGREADADDFPVLVRRPVQDGGGVVDVALDEVAAEPVFEADRALQVDLWVPGATAARLDRLSVSPITSATKPRGGGSALRSLPGGSARSTVTVRQTPLTAMESPGRVSAVTTALRT